MARMIVDGVSQAVMADHSYLVVRCGGGLAHDVRIESQAQCPE